MCDFTVINLLNALESFNNIRLLTSTSNICKPNTVYLNKIVKITKHKTQIC